MDSPLVWIDRPVPEGSSEIPPLIVGQNCLHVGGVNLTDLYYESNNNIHKVAQIVIDYLTDGNFEVFCVRGISYEVLNFVREMMEGFDSNWETSSYEDTEDELWSSHFVFFKKTILTFVDMAVSKIEYSSYLNKFVEKIFLTLYKRMYTKAIDCSGLVVVLKLISMENSYVKILSVALPKLTHEEPVQTEKEKIFRNMHLKKALYTLFQVAETPADSKCCYFVYGSLDIQEGVDLLKSPVDEIMTAGQLTMILPDDENGYYGDPNVTTVVIEKLQYFDPELVVPLNTQGISSFLYHSTNTVTQAMCMKVMIDSETSITETSHDNPCGGKFLLLDHEVTKRGRSILKCSLL